MRFENTIRLIKREMKQIYDDNNGFRYQERDPEGSSRVSKSYKKYKTLEKELYQLTNMNKRPNKLIIDKETIKVNLLGIRNQLYENLPIGDIDSFELIKIIRKHINMLDNIINAID